MPCVQVERQAALQTELANAREAQKAAKIQQRAEMARVEHDEFMRVLAVNRAKEAEERQMMETTRQIHERFKSELQTQILTNDEKRKHDRQVRMRGAYTCIHVSAHTRLKGLGADHCGAIAQEAPLRSTVQKSLRTQTHTNTV